MDDLLKEAGQLLTVGFHGLTPDDEGVKRVLDDAEHGRIGGVILFRYNIKDSEQLQTLTRALHTVSAPYPLFIFVDQEGGKVQRIKEEHGYHDYPSAHAISGSSLQEAKDVYVAMAADLKRAGFTINCAPCVDLDCDKNPSPAIGKLERSYGSCSETVVAFATQMIDAQGHAGILSCLKHFPGHGRACGDTHEGLIDVTDTWSEEELEPYKILCSRGNIDAVMTAHLIHRGIDPEYPATLSETWLSKLRNELSFQGIIVSDDLHMGAIVHEYSLDELIVRGISAGLDVLLFSNNPLASKAQGIRHDEAGKVQGAFHAQWQVPDPTLAHSYGNALKKALDEKRISPAIIESAIKRVILAKQSMWTASER